MTEPRKTPRTTALDIANDDESLCETAYDKMHAHASALESETQELALSLEALLESALEIIGEPPDRDCRCHISPPCSDCVDHAFTREMFENARSALSRHRAKQEVQS